MYVLRLKQNVIDKNWHAHNTNPTHDICPNYTISNKFVTTITQCLIIRRNFNKLVIEIFFKIKLKK